MVSWVGLTDSLWETGCNESSAPQAPINPSINANVPINPKREWQKWPISMLLELVVFFGPAKWEVGKDELNEADTTENVLLYWFVLPK